MWSGSWVSWKYFLPARTLIAAQITLNQVARAHCCLHFLMMAAFKRAAYMENTKRNSSTAIVRKEIFNTCLLEVRHVIRNRFLIASGEWREANGEGVRFKVSFSFDFQGLPQFVACGIQHTNCSIEQAKSHFTQPGSYMDGLHLRWFLRVFYEFSQRLRLRRRAIKVRVPKRGKSKRY